MASAFLHEPLGRAGGTTNANRLDTFEPFQVDFAGIFYQVAIGIHAPTLIEQHSTIATFAATVK